MSGIVDHLQRQVSIGCIAALGLLALNGSVWIAQGQTNLQTSTEQAPDQTPVFHAVARVVNVDVMVEDKHNGRPVDHLPESSFEILDDGKPQKIAYFSHGDQTRPLAIMLVIDVDTFLYPASFYEEELPPAISKALSQLRPEDAVGLIVTMKKAQDDGIPIPDGSEILQVPTKDRKKLMDAINRMGKWIAGKPENHDLPKGYDIGKMQIAAFLKAVAILQKDAPSERAVVLFIGANTMGTAHFLYFDQGIAQLANTDATVSGLDIRRKGIFLAAMRAALPIAEVQPNERVQAAQHAATATGGEMVKVENDDFASALSKVLGDIKARYSLGFVPQALDGKEHKLKVRVTPAGVANKSQKLVVHARRGYLATDSYRIHLR